MGLISRSGFRRRRASAGFGAAAGQRARRGRRGAASRARRTGIRPTFGFLWVGARRRERRLGNVGVMGKAGDAVTVELAGWVLVGLVVLTAVIGVVPRRFKEVGGPAHGAHAKVESDTPVSRRTAWQDRKRT